MFEDLHVQLIAPRRFGAALLLVLTLLLPVSAMAHEATAFQVGDRWGVRDASGEVAIPAEYELLQQAWGDRDTYVICLSGPSDALVVRIRRTDGHLDIDRYDRLHRNNNGMYAWRDGKMGILIGHTGRVAIPLEYDHIQDTHIPPRVMVEDGRYGLVDDRGRVVLEARYDSIEEGHRWPRRVEGGGKVGMLAKDGRFVVEPVWDDVIPSVHRGDGLFLVERDGLWGLVDDSGQTGIEPRYQRLHLGRDGVHRFVVDGTPGWVDGEGRELDPFDHPERQAVRVTTMQEALNWGEVITRAELRRAAGPWPWGQEPVDPRLSARPGAVQLIVRPDSIPWHLPLFDTDVRTSLTLYVVNTTGTEVRLEAASSVLNVVAEARDRDGTWRPIEVWHPALDPMDGSTCVLRPGHQLPLRGTRYEGPRRTRLRYVLRSRGLEITSDVFKGSIDPGQFENPPERESYLPD